MLFNDFVDVLKIPDVAVITPSWEAVSPTTPPSPAQSWPLRSRLGAGGQSGGCRRLGEAERREGDLVITLGCGDIYKASKMIVADNNK